MSRIIGESAALDESGLFDFFQARASRAEGPVALVSVMYQDKDPDLAVRRDEEEKALVLPLLALGRESRVLDVGCGVGRWAGPVVAAGGAYVGTDFSPALLEQARRLHPEVAGSFHDLSATQTHHLAGTEEGFSHVICSGVAPYLDDDAVVESLRQCADLCAPSARIYVRESLAVEQRLTLVDEWSHDMETAYHAIYRTAEQASALAERALAPAGFQLQLERNATPPHLSNRRETFQRISLWSRSTP